MPRVMSVPIHGFSEAEAGLSDGEIESLAVNPKDKGWGMLIAGYDGWTLYISDKVPVGHVLIGLRDSLRRADNGPPVDHPLGSNDKS